MYKNGRIGFNILVIVLAYLIVVNAMADWPQFQGPNRDGHAADGQGLAQSWPENGPKEVWSVPLGEGFAGPAIVGNEVYILDRVDSEQDVLRCIALDTGKELWNYSNNAPGEKEFNGSRGTPAVDEKYVFAVSLLGDILCVDRKSHKLVWKKNLLSDYGGGESYWGITQNPVLYKNLLIVAPHGPNSLVVALDKNTGNEVWRSPGLGGPAYSSPVITTLGGTEQIVMLAPALVEESEEDEEDEDESEEEEDEEEDEEALPATVAGISLKDGKILWTYQGWSNRFPIPYPVSLSDDRLLVTGGYGSGSVMLKVTKKGSSYEISELFKLDQKELGPQLHQPILYKGHLYANNNGNEHREGLICMTLDGKVLWRSSDNRKQPKFERGNLLMADGLIVDLDGKKGSLHLIDPSPDGYKELAQAKVLSGKMMWSPMAISQGKLLLRSQDEMKCLDLRNP